MEASHEPPPSRRQAVRSPSAPPFCQPLPAPPRPYRPGAANPPPVRDTVDRQISVGQRTTERWDHSSGLPPAYSSSRVASNENIHAQWASDGFDDEPNDNPRAGWIAIGRGVALLLGTLLLVDLFANGGLAETGPWWLNTRPIPVRLAAGLLGTSAVCLLLFAARGTLPRGIRGIGMLCLALLIVIAIKDATIYYGLLQRGDLHDGPAVAFSLHVISCLAVVLFAVRAAPGVMGLRGTLLTFIGFAGAAVALPIAHVACQGTIDARRSAAAALVAGPRPFEVDTDARLQQRVARAAALYESGLAPSLILTATSNKDHLARMKEQAVAVGVPESDIEILAADRLGRVLDQLGKRYTGIDGHKPVLLVISDPDHLPRLLLADQGAAVRLAGVPSTPTFGPRRSVFLRELWELWRCYLRR